MVETLLSRETDLAGVKIHWPPHLPDINHLHFYLWGYMKDEIRGKNSCYNYSNEEASQRDYRINSCGNSAVRHWKIEPSHSNSILARRRMFEK